MPSQISVSTDVLRKLHRIHRQLADLQHQLDRGPKQAQIRQANVKHQEEFLAKAQADAKTFRMATDGKQLQFKTKEQHVKDLRTKLNAANSNREYQLLKDQIAAEEMANSVLADEILEAMEKADALHAEIQETAAALQKTRQDAGNLDAEIQERQPRLRAEFDRLQAELRECESELPEEIRQAYQRIAKQRGEDALAPVAGQAQVGQGYEPGVDAYYCGGCNQQLPLNMYNALTLNVPVFCKSCGCLLYIPEGQARPNADS